MLSGCFHDRGWIDRSAAGDWHRDCRKGNRHGRILNPGVKHPVLVDAITAEIERRGWQCGPFHAHVNVIGTRMAYAVPVLGTGFDYQGAAPELGVQNYNDRSRAMTFYAGARVNNEFGLCIKRFRRENWNHHKPPDVTWLMELAVGRWASWCEGLAAAVEGLQRQQLTPERATVLSTRMAHRYGGADNHYGWLRWGPVQHIIKAYDALIQGGEPQTAWTLCRAGGGVIATKHPKLQLDTLARWYGVLARKHW